MYESDDLLSDFAKKHREEISVFESLLRDRHFKYHHFLLESTRYLINSLAEPFAQIDNIPNLDISEKQKNKEYEEMKIEIYKTYNIFFQIVIKLNESDETDINLQTGQMINSGILNDLNNYNEILSSINNDIDKNRGIF